ncbi:conserved hypothetical protein, partial [Escherichia coli TA206]
MRWSENASAYSSIACHGACLIVRCGLSHSSQSHQLRAERKKHATTVYG